MKIMQKSFWVIIFLASFSLIYSQSYEEYKENQEAEFEKYKERYETWKELQDTMYREWSEEQKRGESNNLKRVSVSEIGENSVAKNENDYKSNEVKVTAVGSGDTKAEAVSETLNAASEQLEHAVTENDGSTEEHISDKSITAFTDVKGMEDQVEVNKVGDKFIAEVEVIKNTGRLIESAVPSKGKVPQGEYNGEYTGVVIDARSLGYKACLIPVVVDNRGNQLYGPRHVEKARAMNGMVVWETDLNKAIQNKRTGSNPLVVKAVKVIKKTRLQIDKSDRKELEAMAGSTILRECKVAIVVE